MVSDMLWIAAAILIIACMFYMDRRHQKNKTKFHQEDYTEEQKAVEREEEKAKSRRNGPPGAGGMGGGM
ncbi:hypothetical protein [Salibacterium lacus]|uniref:Uncharacterized protein n=1 Tax=Salibacterium lacus TaxID=1898109 RepID=A0ABW5T4Z1_9BACI